MSYHILSNGINLPNNLQQKNLPGIPPSNLDHYLKSKKQSQRHVTFRQINPLHHNNSQIQNIKYNFTYGEPLNQKANLSKHFGNLLSMKDQVQDKIITEKKSFLLDTKQDSKKLSVQKQINPHEKSQRGGSSLSRKRKLKIFPQKYQNKSISPIKSTSPNQKRQIIEIKNQILRLRQQVQNLSSSYSKHTSREFSQSIYQNEAEQTKRLSQLNQFNEKLLEVLALKLKKISISQYQAYQKGSQQNKQFLDSILSSSQKQGPRLNPMQLYSHNSDQMYKSKLELLDMSEFQKNQKKSENKLQSNPNLTELFNLLPKRQTHQVNSPFLVKRDYNLQDDVKRTDFFSRRNKVDKQPFTFHKNLALNQSNLINKISQEVLSLVPQQQNNIKEIGSNQIKVFEKLNKNQPRPYYLDDRDKQKKEIKDFNRQLEKKMIKRKSASVYSYYNHSRKY